MLLYNYLYPELANLVSCSRIAKLPSYKSSHSTHVERDCGRVVGSLFVGISEKKATTYYVGRLYLRFFMFPRNSLMEWGVPSLHHLKARPAFM